MIQRIQTVFLALVVILGIIFSFIPILIFSGEGESLSVMNAYKTIIHFDGSSEILMRNMGVGVLQGLIILVALASIFLFKNRGLQMKLGKLNILLIALQIAAIVFYSDAVKALIQTEPNDIGVNLQAGAIIPVLSLIFTYLAVYFIKKDEKLVRAADRLR
jgi:hypothetical protein